MVRQSQGQDEPGGVLPKLDTVIETLDHAKEASRIPRVGEAYDSVGALLTEIRKSTADGRDYIDIGLACVDACRALDRGLDRKQLDEHNTPVLSAIGQLTMTAAEIRRKITTRGEGNIISQLFHRKKDKATTTTWEYELGRILHTLNMELLSGYRGAPLNIRCNPFAGQEGVHFRRQSESWEEDLVAFLRACNAAEKKDQERGRAQKFADELDLALGGELHQSQRRHYLRHLRKLCGVFGILPSSFLIEPIFDEHGTTPVGFGGFSDVYQATLQGRRVAVKTLRVTTTKKPGEVHKILVEEVVGWKWLQHENILPFIGTVLAPPRFSIVSEWMEHGDIIHFIRTYPNYNRLRLLIDAATGLEYLHEQGIVHGDLKGANILIGSDYRARLADFGLTAVADESATGSLMDNVGMRGTIRWMAPELLNPEKFGITKESQIRLPSRGTDIYALGMTILEVITGRRPFDDNPGDYGVMYNVIEGIRPDRPPLGFTDPLWGMLMETWVVEDGSRLQKRPAVSAVLHCLNAEVGNWGTSIVPPPIVERTQRWAGYRAQDSTGSNRMATTTHRTHQQPLPSQPGPSRRTGYPGVTGDPREFSRPGAKNR